MTITTTGFRDLVILEPEVHKDERGYFFEAFNSRVMHEAGLPLKFVQDNQSYSKKGVMRGLHFQHPPFAQTKLVRALSGVIQDIVVDLRKDEPTYRKSFSLEMSEENQKQLWVPKGFAHGFLVLSDHADVLYKCDEYYHPEFQGGIFFNDPALAIDWLLPVSSMIVSKRDEQSPLLADAIFNFG